jgi:hypothetical protein
MNYIDSKKKLPGFSILVVPLIVISASLLTSCGGGDGEGADPGIVDYPIAYVNRTYPVDNNDVIIQDDVSDPTLFSAGGDLYVKTIQSSEVAVTTGITQGIGDVKDVDVSYDGTKLIFSLRLADPDPNDQIIPRWNIWEYDLTSKNLTRLIADSIIAKQGDDVAPTYLPDGSIVFSSNRQAFSKLQRQSESQINNTTKPFYASRTEDRSTIAFMLHTMDSYGENIKQISFNQSHDLDPTVLSNGRIAFSRWDNVANRGSGIHIYSINPDGSDLQLVYGSHSHDTGTNNAIIQFTQPRELTNGNLLTIMRPFNGTFSGGDIVELNSSGAVDLSQSPATTNTITTDGSISPGGRYSSAYPLWDGSGRMLVSKAICQIMVGGTPRLCIEPYISDITATEIPPAYGIWLYDRANNAEKPLVQAQSNRKITDVVATQPRTYPATVTSQIDTALEADGMGLLHIRSVYDMDGTYNDFGSGIPDIQTMASSATPAVNRPARFVRILKTIGMPDPNDPTINAPNLMATAFGRDRNLGMREIIGYAPVDPDGSVMVKVPANIPLTIEVLNSRGVRIGDRHQAWIQVAAGETRSCNGCHTHPNTGTPLPHGRTGVGAQAVNQGADFTIQQPLPTTLDTDPNLYAVSGETMAEVRYNRCVKDLVACGVATRNFDPTVNVMYEDYWANTPNAPFNYDYSGASGLTTASPSSTECQVLNPNREANNKWTKECRTTINYVDHIEPLWTIARTVNAADAKCTTCHNTRDAANVVQVPAASLNLTNNRGDYPADATLLPNAEQVPSYIELMFNRDLLLLVGGNLRVSGTRDMNDVLIAADRASPPLRSAGARFGTFITKLTTTMGTVDHTGYLTDAELRLVAEWADIGGQYYNDPFDPNAPQN